MVILEGSITAVLQINKQIDLLRAGITNDEIARGAAQSIAAVDKDIAFALLGGVARPGYVPAGKTVDAILLTELEKSGVHLTPENVMRIMKLDNGRIIFLESGTEKAGLRHIVKEHGAQFKDNGVSKEMIRVYYGYPQEWHFRRISGERYSEANFSNDVKWAER